MRPYRFGFFGWLVGMFVFIFTWGAVFMIGLAISVANDPWGWLREWWWAPVGIIGPIVYAVRRDRREKREREEELKGFLAEMSRKYPGSRVDK